VSWRCDGSLDGGPSSRPAGSDAKSSARLCRAPAGMFPRRRPLSSGLAGVRALGGSRSCYGRSQHCWHQEHPDRQHPRQCGQRQAGRPEDQGRPGPSACDSDGQRPSTCSQHRKIPPRGRVALPGDDGGINRAVSSGPYRSPDRQVAAAHAPHYPQAKISGSPTARFPASVPSGFCRHARSSAGDRACPLSAGFVPDGAPSLRTTWDFASMSCWFMPIGSGGSGTGHRTMRHARIRRRPRAHTRPGLSQSELLFGWGQIWLTGLARRLGCEKAL